MAYNSSRGVCFEALKDISVGEELMVQFDKSYKGMYRYCTLYSAHHKQHQRKVFLTTCSVHLDGHTLGFYPQSQKLAPPCAT